MPSNVSKNNVLPIIDSPGKSGGSSRQYPPSRLISPIVVHGLRVLLFATIILIIRVQHQQRLTDAEAARSAPVVDMERVQAIFPNAAGIGRWRGNGAAEVLDGDARQLGSLIHTASESKKVIGYVGSTYLLVVFDDQEVIVGVFILESDDTVEHVDEIRDHEFFLKSWNGLTWVEAAQKQNVDTVSGATLTSLAIVQSLRARLGSSQPSLKFPKPIQLNEIQQVMPAVTGFEKLAESNGWFRVLGAESNEIGYVLRSSPVADHVHGYQGPTDFLTFFDVDKKYLRTVIRSSFDNMEPEPFVEYVRDEEYFLVDQFSGLTLTELAELDEFDVEGVSGATMTSGGVFRALQYASKQAVQGPQENQPVAAKSWSIGWRDYGTLAVLLAACLMSFTRLKSVRSLRIVFQLILIVYLGFLNGDILSQTVLVGWAQNSLPWSNALGLVVLGAAAIVVPILSKKNLYCQAICPFGAMQLLAGRAIRKKRKLPRMVYRSLKIVPAILLTLAFCVGLFGWPVNLAAIEPFDAFSFRIAGWAALGIAVFGLVGSFFIPMAYCKFGCPTGGLLEFLRRTARADRLGKRDYLAITLLAIALIIFGVR